jgi:FtsZ-interacting cell division protein ZipA
LTKWAPYLTLPAMLGLDPTAIILLTAIAVVVLVVVGWAMGRRRGGGQGTHQMGREDSISYFRDHSGPASGVQEEDSVGRWGGRDDRPG